VVHADIMLMSLRQRLLNTVGLPGVLMIGSSQSRPFSPRSWLMTWHRVLFPRVLCAFVTYFTT